VEDAQKVRQDNGVSDLAPVVRLDLKRSLQKFRDGDRKEALDIGESILTRIKAAGQEKATLIDEPVRSLALMYAAEGRVADARALYATYIFPKSDPLRLGEEQVLSYQLALANIEAYYAPDQQTLSTLSSLLERARARVKSSPALEHDVRRAMAFAYHRLGDGAKARNAAQAALQGRAGIQTQAANAAADRKLIEAYVGGDWLASRALH
jgi:hypothetical protein